MKARTLTSQHHAIVYDGERVADPVPEWFEPEFWDRSGRLTGVARGRGTAVFIDAPFGPAVLRKYLRGGWPSRLSRDRYLFMGYRRSRPFREFALLAELSELGLPVPSPLAALCHRRGALCRGALLTRTLPAARALADWLPEGLPPERWKAIGACIARFHAAGVRHADLNARNVLVAEAGDGVYLVDFDRGRLAPGRRVPGRANLARLRRSLEKLWPRQAGRDLPACWGRLLEGYHA